MVWLQGEMGIYNDINTEIKARKDFGCAYGVISYNGSDTNGNCCNKDNHLLQRNSLWDQGQESHSD
jgi:hypothetical protein